MVAGKSLGALEPVISSEAFARGNSR